MHHAIRRGATLLCLAATAASAYNVYGDNEEVEKVAERVACGDIPGCHAGRTRTDRTPFAQSFEFAIPSRATSKSGGGSVAVRCARSGVLVGGYTCTLHPPDR